MKLAAAPRILIVSSLCAIALVGLVIIEGNARAGGLEALMPMEAVDPRALLSGHFVQISLTERLDAGAPCPPGADSAKWLALRNVDGVYRLAGGANSRDEALQLAPTPLLGSFQCWAQPLIEGVPDSPPGSLRIDVGIDRFYVNQTEALRIERVLREQRPDETARAFAIVSIGRDGHARLKGLVIDGERLELNWF